MQQWTGWVPFGFGNCCFQFDAESLFKPMLTYSWWRHQMETFSALLALCAGNSPHKGQWRGALMFSLICARINNWVNNREAGDLIRHRGHYDVNVMLSNRPFRTNCNEFQRKNTMITLNKFSTSESRQMPTIAICFTTNPSHGAQTPWTQQNWAQDTIWK